MTMHAAAVAVVKRLQQANHVALFAGGCVRDRVMGRRPHDYDIATDAKPDEVIALFPRTQKVGAKFGVILVRVSRFPIEVATFRTDAGYRDGRHPTKVHFTNAAEDARRRDFTINGMFYDPINRELVDLVRGKDDLEARLIRAIGDPQRRFAEDHLRILRGVRFAARFGFAIHRGTLSAMRANAASLRRISPERIREELDAILSHASRAEAFKHLAAAGALQYLWTGAEALLPSRGRIEAFLESLPPKAGFALGLAVLLHTFSPDEAAAACGALRCSNQAGRTTTWLVANQDTLMNPSDLALADLKLLMARPAFGDLMKMCAAKLRALGRSQTPYRTILARMRDIPADEVAPPPLIDGRYLEKLGLPRGPIYKRILDKVYYAQLNGDLPDRAAAKAHTKRLIKEG